MPYLRLWMVISVVALGVTLRNGFPRPELPFFLAVALCFTTELAAVRLPGFGFFSTGFAVALALASADAGSAGWPAVLITAALVCRAFGRSATPRETLADLAPALCALAALGIFSQWQARCLAGIVIYYLVSELCQPQLANEQETRQFVTFRTTRESTTLYRLSILFLAPVLVCLHLYDPLYILLGLPILAGVQRAAFSEMARLRLLDQEILLRKEAQSRLALAQTQDQLDIANRHLRFREFSEAMLLELTRELASSQDVRNTAQAAIRCLSNRIHYRQLAVFVRDKATLAPLFWSGSQSQPSLPMMVEQQVAAGQVVVDTVSAWPLEREGALMVDVQGQAALSPEEIYLVGLVASQTALGLQSARRYREQQETQAGVLLASKMAAVGQLAAGVAHELNTPLGAVQLQIELVQMQTNLNTTSQKAIDVAQKAVEHAQTIISRLLYYSREGATQKQNLDLNQIVQDTLQLLQSQLKIDGVEVATELCPHCRADVNANEIQQVLTNLVLNAKDACLEPGAQGKNILVRTRRGGQEVAVEVYDQGAGVPDAIRERIFEPFFTSKPVGKGVGLGLSVSAELVAQHGGQLQVENAAPPWTTLFRLRLPATG
jgi:signal transduction histidine kinase